MKKILIATVAAIAMSGAASAADMAIKARPMAPAPVYNWTGCYIDGGGGAGMWNDSHTTFNGGIPITGEQTTGGRGWYGEVGGGCDYQFQFGGLGNFVIGVLGGYDFMSLKGSYTDSAIGLANGYEKETGAGFVGARIGYLITPNLLTYTSGGWTDAKFNGFGMFTPGAVVPTAVLASHTYNGWFLGGGAETSLGPWLPTGFFLRTDYRWSTYNVGNMSYFNAAGAPLGTLTTRSNKYVQQIGTELIYRFNWH